MLTLAQKNAIKEYQKGNYGIIGQYLRSGRHQQRLHAKTNNIIRTINSVINQSPRGSKNMIVYRGYTPGLIENGKNLLNRSFLSTSTRMNVAKKFGSDIVKITVPKNLKRHVMKANGESEILIERGTRLINVKEISKNKYSARLTSNKTPFRLSPDTPLGNFKKLVLNSNNESSNFNNNN